MSLDEAIRRYEAGEVYINSNAPEGPDLPDSFWENAVVYGPRLTRPVSLKLDAFVFQHFVDETGGKGHITRMQDVLKSYVRAMQAKAQVTDKG
jgi:uncharacterized protein (DUF4415 family)